uniref:Uncharacterized protein n=1 Tax=Zea mays TaxID=4577 RepID=B6T0B2_MAIZE|nr:hypothetical protein [Zea mays]
MRLCVFVCECGGEKDLRFLDGEEARPVRRSLCARRKV